MLYIKDYYIIKIDNKNYISGYILGIDDKIKQMYKNASIEDKKFINRILYRSIVYGKI